MAAQFAAMGTIIDPEEIENQQEAVEVWKVNWDSVRAFLACETQWRCVAAPAALIWTGLDYSGVDVALRRSQFPDDVFSDLQVMEIEALAAFREASA